MEWYKSYEVGHEMIDLDHRVFSLVNGIAMAKDVLKCLGSGMDDFICKPVHLEELQSKLTTWLK